jgi:NADP-dependent 3-hydroxy acid dehydrogenase YdfG
MTAISGSAAAVTGAASGIGRALALELAARGCDLALADRDEAGLQQVAAEIGKVATRKVSTHRVDVGEPAQIQEFAQAAIAAHPSLNIVINNAGVALLGAFNEVDQAQMEWLININFWGVVHGTRAFLPHLSKQREAHIVNLSSIFGIIAPPGQTAGARLFGKPAARAGDGEQSGEALGGASRRRADQHRAQLPHRRRHHRQCAPCAIDRPL